MEIVALVVLVLVGVGVTEEGPSEAPSVRPGGGVGASASAGAGAGEEGVPTFRVVALGARGSGKTLLLASMYHQMQTASGRGYFLTAPYEQVVLLNQWFTDVADTGRDWPSGTSVGETRDFMFTVLTRAPSGTLHTVLRLGYLEYAGGLLTDAQAPGSTGQADLLDRIGGAHALVGIIDGYRVRQAIDGHAEGLMRLQQSLTAMISLMMLVPSPVTFVITKWDLLYDLDVDEDARLRRVRKFLMSNQGFHDLVQAHSRAPRRAAHPGQRGGPGLRHARRAGPGGQAARRPAASRPMWTFPFRPWYRTCSSRSSGRWTGPRCRPRWTGSAGGTGRDPAAPSWSWDCSSPVPPARRWVPLAPHAAFLGDAAFELFGAPRGQRGRAVRPGWTAS